MFWALLVALIMGAYGPPGTVDVWVQHSQYDVGPVIVEGGNMGQGIGVYRLEQYSYQIGDPFQVCYYGPEIDSPPAWLIPRYEMQQSGQPPFEVLLPEPFILANNECAIYFVPVVVGPLGTWSSWDVWVTWDVAEIGDGKQELSIW